MGIPQSAIRPEYYLYAKRPSTSQAKPEPGTKDVRRSRPKDMMRKRNFLQCCRWAAADHSRDQFCLCNAVNYLAIRSGVFLDGRVVLTALPREIRGQQDHRAMPAGCRAGLAFSRLPGRHQHCLVCHDSQRLLDASRSGGGNRRPRLVLVRPSVRTAGPHPVEPFHLTKSRRMSSRAGRAPAHQRDSVRESRSGLPADHMGAAASVSSWVGAH